MPRTSLTVLALAVLPLSQALVRVPGVATFEPASESQDEKSPLQEAMGVFRDEQRTLKKLSADAQTNRDALLASLAKVEAAALAAIAQEPPRPEGVQGDDLALFRVGFKRTVADLLDATLAMEEATLRGDSEALRAGYEAMAAAKKAGHEGYRDV